MNGLMEGDIRRNYSEIAIADFKKKKNALISLIGTQSSRGVKVT
jgi:hypothetical protein